MKQYWERIAVKIDAKSLRERILIFAVAAMLLITLVNSMLLDPQYAKQKQLSQQMAQDQTKIANIHAEIQEKTRLQALDPDAVNRGRLTALQQQSQQMNKALQDLQKGLVTPDKMASLLESILKRGGTLQLVSLRTLPPTGLTEPSPSEKSISPHPAGTPALQITKDAAGSQQSIESVYKHGVELTIQGSYPDLTNYLKELETMPWQLFWGKAKLNVDEYPKTTLTLTLYTLSLEKKWLNL